MAIIIVEGPEKAGKTTLCRVLEEQFGAYYRHWGPVETDAVYAEAMREDLANHQFVVWDRGWPSEVVYNRWRGDRSRLVRDPWLGEWLYGRGVTAAGDRVILLGPDEATLEAARDETDLPIPVSVERAAYQEYAERFGWTTYANPRDRDFTYRLAEQLASDADAAQQEWDGLLPPRVAGVGCSAVLFIGEQRNNDGTTVAGGWLPFTSRLTERYGRVLGDDALKCAWSNVEEDPLRVVDPDLVVACGMEAFEYASSYGYDYKDTLAIPHPSWLYRWGKGTDRIPAVECELRARVKEALDA